MGYPWLRMVGVGIVLAGTNAVAAPANMPSLAALTTLEKGDWELRTRGEAGAPKHMCIGDGRQLLQLRHPGRSCSRFVVQDAPGRVIVTYDCAAAGNGRTDLRVETPRLAQVQSQGVADGAPFSFAVEARRTGECRH